MPNSVERSTAERSFSNALRQQIEVAIEAHLTAAEELIAVLDMMDDAAAREREYDEHDGCEPDTDCEPTLGSSLASLCDQRMWAAGEHHALNVDERELDSFG